MENRFICDKCGGWMVSSSQYQDKFMCDTCGRVIENGIIDDSECEMDDG